MNTIEELGGPERIEDEGLKRLDGIEGPLSRPLSNRTVVASKHGSTASIQKGERGGHLLITNMGGAT